MPKKGKKGTEQRVKGNVQAASSGRMSELLKGEGFIGFEMLSASLSDGSVGLDESLLRVHSQFQVVLKQMGKKDTVTKIKALQEYISLCEQEPVEGVTSSLQLWPLMYAKLSTDTDRKIRELSHVALGRCGSKVGRGLAPHIRSLIGPLVTGACDLHPPSSGAAREAFSACFPPAKETDVIKFGLKSIVNYCSDIILKESPDTFSDPKTMPEDERVQRYERTVVMAIGGYGYALEKLGKSVEEEGLVEIWRGLVMEKRLWKLMKHPNHLIRNAVIILIKALISSTQYVNQHPDTFCPLLLSQLSEPHSSVVQSLWETSLLLISTVDSWHQHVNIQKALLPGVWQLLGNGGHGNGSIIYPCLLPLLSQLLKVPDCDTTGLSINFITRLKSGLVNLHGLNVGGPNGPPRSSSVCQKPPTVKALHTISPMEAARRENMHLMVQYQTALRNNPNMSIRGSQNLSLNYLRRLEENLSLARQTEKSMAMKLRQREIRLQEESQKLKVRSIDSLTAEQLREEVTQFENGKAKFNGLKQALSSDNSDNTTNLVVNLIHEVLNTTDHPLRRLFGECQYNIIQILQPVVREIERSGCNDLPKLNITQIQKDCTDPSPSSSLNEQRVSPKVLTRPHSFSVPEDITLAQVKTRVPGHFENTSPLNSPSSTGSNGNTEEIEERFEDEDLKTMPEFKTMRQDEDYDDDDDDEFETLKANQDEEGLSTMKSERGRDEDTEEEDEVIFPSLVPLSCTPLFGDKDKIQSLALKFDGLLDETVKLIHSALKKIMTSFVSIYTSLSSRDNYDICKTAIESLFFPAILPMLTSLYRCSRYNKECSVAVNMMKHVNSTPKDIAVRKKYWLNDQAMPPYLAAIEQLKSLPRLQCPSLKLDCLVTLSKIIVQTIDDYYFTGHSSFSSSSSSCSEKEINKEDISVGVDDLLPIMTYIIIRSGMPQLVTESAVLQEFVDENYLMGEEGFCLTTFDTALRYVEVMSSS